MLVASGEHAFFEAIRSEASEALRVRLDLIDAYEALCRPIESAFLYALHASTRKGPGRVGIDELAAGALGQAMAARIEPALDQLAAVATEPAVNLRVRPLLERYAGVRDAAALFETVLSQHEENQRRKPPDGRRPWFERPDGCPVVRQRYAQHEAPPTRGYVHDYRCHIALRFLRELGEVRE